MKREDFIAASTSTRIYEDDLLKKRDFERLNDYESLKQVLSALSDSAYGKYIGELARDEEYEIVLSKELKRVYDKISEISPDKSLTDYLIEKYNFHNLKVLVKELIQEADYREIYSPMASIDIDLIRKNIINPEADFFASYDEGIKPYLTYAKEAIKAYEDSKNPAMIDISLDKSYYERELDLAQKTGLDSLLVYTRESIDLINIKTLLRIRSQKLGTDDLSTSLIDGGYIDREDILAMFSSTIDEILVKTSTYKVNSYLTRALDRDKDLTTNLLDLEKAIDDHFCDFAKESKSITYGPEVLLAYLIGKEEEIKNLRIIFISKLNSLDKNFTRERLRECIN